MLRVGLTGGIASGKSAASAAFRELGVPVIDADAVAHELMAPGQRAHEQIVARFGEGIRGADGRIDRAALGAIVFADDEARRELEAMIHPAVMAEIASRLSRLAAEGVPIAVCEVPLLVEAGLTAFFDRVVVVVAGRETRLRRIRSRDGLTPEAAAARIAAQMPTEDKVAVADDVLCNDGTLEELREQVAALHARLLEAANGGAD